MSNDMPVRNPEDRPGGQVYPTFSEPRLSTLSGEPCPHPDGELCVECATDEEIVASLPPVGGR